MSLPNSNGERIVRLEEQMETAMRDIAEEKEARKTLETTILTRMDAMNTKQEALMKIVYKAMGGVAAIMGVLEILHLVLTFKAH